MSDTAVFRPMLATTTSRRPSRRVFIVSDLHLGGTPAMMGRPRLLASFIASLPARLEKDEALELVIAGDVIDFLAIQPYADLTRDPAEALAKLSTVTEPRSDCAPIFDELGRHVAAGHKVS